MTTSIAEWRYQSKKRLIKLSDSPEIEINAILCEVLQKDISWCLANPEQHLNPSQIQQLDAMLNALTDGLPLAYVLGYCEFFGLKFKVDQNVLIPRPETELLVEQAIQWFSAHPDSKRVVDVGIGSGAILISLMKQFPWLVGYGIDISKAALAISKKNMKNHQLKNHNLVQMDCLNGVNGKFDVILANLPYIPQNEAQYLKVSKFEPLTALNGGDRGVEIIFRLIDQIPTHLSIPGLVLLEIQYDQAKIVIEKVKRTVPYGSVSTINDLAGINRLVRIEV